MRTAVFRKQVLLVGMPGVGKSTVGRHLARRLESTFCDTDQLLEERLGCSIGAFFQQEGEHRFREVEADLLRELVERREPHVIATGGGIVTQAPNRVLIATCCTGVYLRARPEQIFGRLRRDTRRPLLQVADPLGRLRELHAQRDALYSEVATFTIDMHERSLVNVVNKIAMQLELAELDACAPGPSDDVAEGAAATAASSKDGG